MANSRTLADLGISSLFLFNGAPMPGDPADYEVVEWEDEGQKEFARYVAPDGSPGVMVRDITGVRMFPDTEVDSIEDFKRGE